MSALRDLRRLKTSNTVNILPSDTVIFIVGPSGSGKSWFFRELTNSKHSEVNMGLRPCTREVNAMRCRLQHIQKDIIFVDTPSFFTFEIPDGDVIMRAWMNSW
ncbi:hypothetical protein ID866_5825 [Astraeus odoratus]|nr:hypothetical protein ID866_5825 [Astraeus odoratus]